MTAETEIYERGRREGEVDARLKGHDEHFKKINGSIDRFTIEMGRLAMAVQRLGDDALARDATASAVDATGAANASRRQRLATIASAAAAAVIATLTAYALFKGKGG